MTPPDHVPVSSLLARHRRSIGAALAALALVAAGAFCGADVVPLRTGDQQAGRSAPALRQSAGLAVRVTRGRGGRGNSQSVTVAAPPARAPTNRRAQAQLSASTSTADAYASAAAAYASAAPLADAVTPSGPTWRPPVQGPVVVLHGFAAPPEPWLVGHRGVDLVASAGSMVRAAGAGVVVFAGSVAGRGVVSVQHGELRTTYEPVTATAHPGDEVEAGAPIGLVQDVPGHCAPAVCLHWGLRRGTAYLDPLLLIAPRRPPRLLPLDDDVAAAAQ